jgi:hypothetical protein
MSYAPVFGLALGDEKKGTPRGGSVPPPAGFGADDCVARRSATRLRFKASIRLMTFCGGRRRGEGLLRRPITASARVA